MRRGGHRAGKKVDIQTVFANEEPPPVAFIPNELERLRALVGAHGPDVAATQYTVERLRAIAADHGIELGRVRLARSIVARMCAT